MTAKEWIGRFATALGAEPPDDEQFDEILALAAEAAHASERTAAPVACWLAAAAGRTPGDALDRARGVPAG
jgi:Domain of unknown function (DUF6457)